LLHCPSESFNKKLIPTNAVLPVSIPWYNAISVQEVATSSYLSH
jgi:hypothetical protein